MKTIALSIIGMALCLIGISYSTRGIESKLGEKFIFENDTVTVIDYSLLTSTYSLSNGAEVSFKLIDKLPKVK